jgi:hypothetical protein
MHGICSIDELLCSIDELLAQYAECRPSAPTSQCGAHEGERRHQDALIIATDRDVSKGTQQQHANLDLQNLFGGLTLKMEIQN